MIYTNMIYTIQYMRQEAEVIANSWNGSDEKYQATDGEIYTDEQAQAATDLLGKLEEVELLVDILGI